VLAGEGWIWLHLNLADQRCLRWLTHSLAVPQGRAAEFAETAQRQYLSCHGDYLTGHLNDFRQEFDRECTEQAWLHLLMGFYIALGLCLLSSAAVWLFLWNASRR
jgi:zinc transporter